MAHESVIKGSKSTAAGTLPIDKHHVGNGYTLTVIINYHSTGQVRDNNTVY